MHEIKERMLQMSINNEQKTIVQLREQLAKLKQELASEASKEAMLKKKIVAAEAKLKRTQSESTRKSKLNEIERCNSKLAVISKKCGQIQKKIGNKERELATAQKRLSVLEKKDLAEKKKVTKRQFDDVNRTLQLQAERQDCIEEEIRALKELPEEITILFLASNPADTTALCLGEEARNIYEKIRLSEYRDTIKFETRWAVRTGDVLQAINETNPTIIHFSGHGCGSGELVLQNPDGTMKLVAPEAISQTIATVSDAVKLVFFNACYSETQAQQITEHIDAAIGMSDSIGDEAACVFAAQFYSSIGFGLSVNRAFKQAIAALLLEDINEEQTPKLVAREDIDLNELYLVAKENTQ